MIWLTNSKHTSIRSCRTWKSRSPGVETARCTVPASSRNGCSSAGRGPEKSRSRTASSPPGSMVSTMNIAAVVRGAITGCGSGSGSGRATAGTCDHSVTRRPFPVGTKLPRGKVSRDCSRHRPRAGSAPLAQPAAPPEHDDQDDNGQHLGADAEDEERRQRPFPVHQPAQVLPEEPGQERQRQEHGGDDGELLLEL